VEIVLNTTNVYELIEVARTAWPELFSEEYSDGDSFFVFKNFHYADVFFDNGLNSAGPGTMIEFVIDENSIILVCDDKDDPVVKEILHYAEPLKMNN
jgi:hypothetical protein